MAVKFFKCNHCGNVIVKAVDGGVVPFCCGEKMTELTANTVEASQEKHLPVVEKIDNCKYRIKVGSVEHPMTPEHYIQWIDIQTTGGIQRVQLTPSDKPEATFTINDGDSVVAVYEYCNLHGLWKA